MLIIFSDLFNENTFFSLQFKYIQLFSGYRDIYNIRSLSENKNLFVRACLLAYRLEILIVNLRKLIIEVICCEEFMLHV
jgi:hypothetical protein